MDTPEEIWKLSQERYDEAQILCQSRKWNGAFYLAGYSIEFALKAKICELYGVPNMFKLDDIAQKPKGSKPDEKFDEQRAKEMAIDILKKQVMTHNLYTLMFFSCLREKFDQAKAENPNFSKLSSLLFNGWHSEVRYKPCGHFTDTDVEKLITLLPELLSWIRSS